MTTRSLVERAVEREKKERESKKRQEDAIALGELGPGARWKSAYAQLRAVQAFSSAGERQKSKRIRRQWRVALLKVLATVVLLRSVRGKTLQRRWRVAALKIRAAQRFAGRDKHSTRWKRRIGQSKQLKRCHVCVLVSTPRHGNAHAGSINIDEDGDDEEEIEILNLGESWPANGGELMQDYNKNPRKNKGGAGNSIDLEGLLHYVNGNKLKFGPPSSSSYSSSRSSSPFSSRPPSPSGRHAAIVPVLSDESAAKFTASARSIRPVVEKSVSQAGTLVAETDVEMEEEEEEDYECDDLLHLIADQHAEEQLDEHTFSERWNELLFKVDDNQSQASEVLLDSTDNEECLSDSDEDTDLEFDQNDIECVVVNGTAPSHYTTSSNSSISSCTSSGLMTFELEKTTLKGANTDDHSATGQGSQYFGRTDSQSRRTRSSHTSRSFRTSANDFEPLRIVGTGGTGQVYLVQHIETRKRFAMKVLNKAEVISGKRINRVITEREILTKANESPFITQLKFAFHSLDMLFFVMEYCSGGNLHEVMIREHEIRHMTLDQFEYKMAMDAAAEGHGLFGSLTLVNYFTDAKQLVICKGNKKAVQSRKKIDILRSFGLVEAHVCFILSEIVEGLLFLHRKGFVYRDLKPQNVMLNVDGHIRIGDFGVSKLGIYDSTSKVVDLRSNSFVGTIEYMAPEVVSGEPQQSLVDNWGLGIVMYELLFGAPPFLPSEDDEDNRTLFRKILQPSKSLQFPASMECSAHAVDLIEKLLQKDPSSRVGLEEMKSHPFFRTVNWNNLNNSSGFHKLTPRIHLHRSPCKRPSSLNLLANSKSRNIFLSPNEVVTAPHSRSDVGLSSKLQRSLSSSIMRMASRGNSPSPLDSRGDMNYAGQQPVYVETTDPSLKEENLSNQNSEAKSNKSWIKRMGRFVPSSLKMFSNRAKKEVEAAVDEIFYSGFTRSVDKSQTPFHPRASSRGSFHSGRTRDKDSATSENIQQKQQNNNTTFLGFEWKCET